MLVVLLVVLLVVPFGGVFGGQGGEVDRLADLVVVGVDEKSMDDLGARWPFSRTLQARALTRLSAARPRVIAYDIQLSEQTTDADDQAMADALGAAGPVVLATTRYDPEQGPDVLFEGGAITVGHREADTGAAGSPARRDRRTDVVHRGRW